MLKIIHLFYPLHYCFLLVSFSVFAQTEVYKSNFVLENFHSPSVAGATDSSQQLFGSLLISGDKIVFNASNYKIYIIKKSSLQPIC